MTSSLRKTLYIHAGMQKTGSTSIQVTLSETPTTPGYQFLFRENGNSGFYLRTMFDASFLGNVNEKGKARGAGIQAFSDRIEKFLQRPKPTFVISSEMICSAFGTASLSMIRDWFATKVDEIRVVIYVREPFGYIESLFQEQLKKRSVEFVRLSRMSPAYKTWFSEVEEVFGAENVIYRHFNTASLRNGDVVSDFIATTGLDIPEESVVRKNEGLSRRGVAVVANFNHQLASRTHHRDMRATRWITRLATMLPGSKLRLSNELLTEAIQDSGEDIRWMEARLGCPLGHLNRKAAADGITDLQQVLALDEETRRWAVEVLGVPPHATDFSAALTARLQVASQAEDPAILRQTRRHFAADDAEKTARREARAADAEKTARREARAAEAEKPARREGRAADDAEKAARRVARAAEAEKPARREGRAADDAERAARREARAADAEKPARREGRAADDAEKAARRVARAAARRT